MSTRTFNAGHPWMLTPKQLAAILVTMTYVATIITPTIARADACDGSLTGILVAGAAEDGVCNGPAGETVDTSVSDCIDRSTTHAAYYAEAVACQRGEIYSPTSIAEAQRMMRQIVTQNRRVKIAGEGHSNTDIICSDHDVITTNGLRGIGAPSTFEGITTMRIEAGVSFADLQAAAHNYGYAIDVNAPGYGQIHVLGGLATGLHGGSPEGVSSVSAIMQSLEVMDPSGTITQYTRGTSTSGFALKRWRALSANLGLLGFITAARVRVVPQFALDTVTIDVPASDFFADVAGFDDGCTFAFTSWFPATNRVKSTCGIRVPANQADPTAWNSLFSPRIDSSAQDIAVIGFQGAFCSPALNNLVEIARFAQTSNWLSRIENGQEVSTNRLIGFSHRITTLPNFREGQPRFSSRDWEVAVPESKLDETITILSDVLAGNGKPLMGMVSRQDRATNDTILGGNAVRPGVVLGEKIFHIEVPTYLGYMATPTEENNYHSDVIEAFDEIIHTIPEARFHWGKNREDTFSNPTYMATMASQRAEFSEVLAVMDPLGVFSNPWARRSGFNSPQFGQNFANYYFPACATAAGAADTDNDGLKACTESVIGSSATTQNGAYLRVSDVSIWDGADISGGCHNYDNWNEIKSYSRFGAPVFLLGTAVREQRFVRSGLEFDVDNQSHNYRDPHYNFAPALTSGGLSAFGLMFSANMNFAAGTYCFSNDNESPGTGQDTGWNSCAQTWVDKTLRTEVGYNASPRTPVSCVTLSAGNHRLDWVTRFQDAFFTNVNSYASHPRWCQVTSGTSCVPDREFEQHLLTPNTSL